MIEFENAGFSYGTRSILRDMSLKLTPGAFNVLLGTSGAGKTTLLRLCYMDLMPTSGVIRFFGKQIPGGNRNAIADLRRSIGVVQQECRFLDQLTVIENISLPLRVSGIVPESRAADLQSLLEWVDLTDRVEARPAELSGGERQCAALARAVILSPEVILADEPTRSIDADTALRLLGLLVELNRMGKTVLVATHDLTLIRSVKARVATRVMQLAQGQIQIAGADL